jgi:hypothetical protein
VFSIRQFDGDYGSFRITLALMGMLLVGGTRLRHLRVLERDPLFLRFARLQRLPTDRTVANTLKETTSAVRDRLGDLLRDVAYDTARQAGLSRFTENERSTQYHLKIQWLWIHLHTRTRSGTSEDQFSFLRLLPI